MLKFSISCYFLIHVEMYISVCGSEPSTCAGHTNFSLRSELNRQTSPSCSTNMVVLLDGCMCSHTEVCANDTAIHMYVCQCFGSVAFKTRASIRVSSSANIPFSSCWAWKWRLRRLVMMLWHPICCCKLQNL